MPELKRQEKTRRPRIGDVVKCEVIRPHDGVPAGEIRKVRYTEAVDYVIREGFWRIIG